MTFLSAGQMKLQVPTGKRTISSGFYRNLAVAANKNRNGGWLEVPTRRFPQEV